MSTTCPTCAAADETVAVREALLDTDRPLDPPMRELLSMPSEPGGASVAAITLFVLAGLFGLLGLRALLSGDGGGNGDNSDTAYQAGYHYGALLVAAILLGIGLAVHAPPSEASEWNRRPVAADLRPVAAGPPGVAGDLAVPALLRRVPACGVAAPWLRRLAVGRLARGARGAVPAVGGDRGATGRPFRRPDHVGLTVAVTPAGASLPGA
ncbi:hypothetical protein ACGF0D_37085 [Kitasatospora sp. NPDC048298]|uniref:hypothetical protein n=1 Tax=Kitasatospora sp. NPDC048298 TaxID=3364049 RepID=UPI00371A4F7E